MEVDLNQGFRDCPGLRCFLGYLTKTEDEERDGSVSHHFHLLLLFLGLPTQDPLPGLSWCPTGSAPANLPHRSERWAGNNDSCVSSERPGDALVGK